jgi:hypothetical protein
MNTLDFGGYVSYTAGGYKCHSFGTELVRSEIDKASPRLDIPTSLSLRPGRVGFRRTILSSRGSMIFVYTAFVGLSEPEANRLGSFLAIGVAVPGDLNCENARVGQTLHSLLAELEDLVSDGVRFNSTLNIDSLSSFLNRKAEILEGFRSLPVIFNRQSQKFEFSNLVLLSEEQLALTSVFNQVCDKLPPQDDLFLFAVSARQDVQSARHDFRIISWPFPEENMDLPPVGQAAPSPARLQLSEPAAVQSAHLSNADIQRLRNIDQIIQTTVRQEISQFVALAENFRFWRLVVIVAFCFLFLFLTIFVGVSYRWNSSLQGGVSVIKERLERVEKIKAGIVPLEYAQPEAAVNAEGYGGQYLPSPMENSLEPERSDVIRLEPMIMPSEILKIYCSNNNGLNKFTKELARLNPSAVRDDKSGAYKIGQILRLPTACNR